MQILSSDRRQHRHRPIRWTWHDGTGREFHEEQRSKLDRTAVERLYPTGKVSGIVAQRNALFMPACRYLQSEEGKFNGTLNQTRFGLKAEVSVVIRSRMIAASGTCA